MARRRGGYLAREWRRAKRAMRPDRVAARFISGGRHQSFGSILRAPTRATTVTHKGNRRKWHQAAKRREQRAAQAERRRQQQAAQRARKQAAAKKKAAPRKPQPRKPNPVIAVNARTGKPITWAQAQRAVREAQQRAERLAKGLPGDAPASKPRPPRKAKPAPSRPAVPRKRVPRSGTPRPARPRVPRNLGPVSAPASAPGKNLRGVYYAATCPCQGTGRIAVQRGDGLILGSTSCPKHGRTARGKRKVLSRRAMTNAGLQGLAGWLASRKGGNRDKQQRRAHRQAERRRYAGPTEPCRACDEGVVNRGLTEQLREQYVARLAADRKFAGRRPLSERTLQAQARRAYPYDHCRECKGLGRVASQRAGGWLRRTTLPQQHRLTARERATGERRP